uniref:Uncharacterized protein n=1 Tax=Glossina austeni TaxID=7395 RepID=A0A1A9UX08_GLOAU
MISEVDSVMDTQTYRTTDIFVNMVNQWLGPKRHKVGHHPGRNHCTCSFTYDSRQPTETPSSSSSSSSTGVLGVEDLPCVAEDTLSNYEHYQLPTKVTYDGIMVLHHGYCFNFESGITKTRKTDKGVTKYVDCTASIALEKRHYILPKVAGALKALYQKHNNVGPAMMISKRWLYSQLVDDCL